MWKVGPSREDSMSKGKKVNASGVMRDGLYTNGYGGRRESGSGPCSRMAWQARLRGLQCPSLTLDSL